MCLAGEYLLDFLCATFAMYSLGTPEYWLWVGISREITKSRLASDKGCTHTICFNRFHYFFQGKNRFRRNNPRKDQKALQWLVSRECPWWWWWWTGACSASCFAWWSCASLGPLGRPSGWYFWCFHCCFLYLLRFVCCTALACLIFVVCCWSV